LHKLIGRLGSNQRVGLSVRSGRPARGLSRHVSPSRTRWRPALITRIRALAKFGRARRHSFGSA